MQNPRGLKTRLRSQGKPYGSIILNQVKKLTQNPHHREGAGVVGWGEMMPRVKAISEAGYFVPFGLGSPLRTLLGSGQLAPKLS